MIFQWSLELEQELTDKKAGRKAVQEEQEKCKSTRMHESGHCSRWAMTSGAWERDDDGDGQKACKAKEDKFNISRKIHLTSLLENALCEGHQK